MLIRNVNLYNHSKFSEDILKRPQTITEKNDHNTDITKTDFCRRSRRTKVDPHNTSNVWSYICQEQYDMLFIMQCLLQIEWKRGTKTVT